MRKIITVGALLARLAVAGPAMAEGDYVVGPTAFDAWSEAQGRTPLAVVSSPMGGGRPGEGRRPAPGGDDQYVAGPTASTAWTGPAAHVPLAWVGLSNANFELASQGN